MGRTSRGWQIPFVVEAMSLGLEDGGDCAGGKKGEEDYVHWGGEMNNASNEALRNVN